MSKQLANIHATDVSKPCWTWADDERLDNAVGQHPELWEATRVVGRS
jgi:hypothetical protein